MEEVINISDFPTDKIYILLEEDYRKKLFHLSLAKLGCKSYYDLSIIINKRYLTKMNGGDISYWIDGQRLDKRTGIMHPKFIPLWLVMFLVKENNISLDILHKKVIAYRSGGKGLIINNPILPIKITPELDSIIIHMFCDGCAGEFTPSYFQKNKEPFDNFIKKLENCFGQFNKSIYEIKNAYQVKFPKAIMDILSSYYNIKSYMSYESCIPNKILKRNDLEFKLACIVAFIVDEGNIRDVISLYSVNDKLLLGIRKLIMDCGYNCSKLQYNIKSKSYLVSLSTKDVEKLHKDVEKLSKNFPTCDLSFKNERLEFLINRRKIKNPRDKEITIKVISNLLNNHPLSALDISKKSNYAYCTIIHNLEKLYKQGKAMRIKTPNNKTFIWSLVNAESTKR